MGDKRDRRDILPDRPPIVNADSIAQFICVFKKKVTFFGKMKNRWRVKVAYGRKNNPVEGNDGHCGGEMAGRTAPTIR